MPRPRKPPRLWRRKTGEWIILDGGRQFGTGGARGEGGRDAALRALRDHIDARPSGKSGPARPDQIAIGDVLADYALEVGQTLAGRATLASGVKRLAGFWGDLACDAVKGATCRAYARHTGLGAWTNRRHLGILQSALNYAVAEGRLIHAPKVTLAAEGSDRDRWLTRDEAAALLRAAPRHLRRFILISLYTGTRASATLALRWMPATDSGWVDVPGGIIHRKGRRETETKKRRGSVKAPRQLAGHLRRWARGGGVNVVEFRGRPIRSVKRAFAESAERAGLENVTPHDLKRTAVTWAFQKGMTMEDAVQYFDTSAKTLEKSYRSHSPHYQARAVAIMESR